MDYLPPARRHAMALIAVALAASSVGLLLAGVRPAALLWLTPVAGGCALAIQHLLASARAEQQKQRDQEAQALAQSAKTRDVQRFDIIDALPDPILVLSADLRIQALNTAASSQFGGNGQGTPLSVYLRHPAVIEAAQEAVQSGKPAEREAVLRAASDRAYRVRCGQLPGSAELVMTLQDVTQARLTERMRVDFVANASHELRTPLSTLVGFIETLRGKAMDDLTRRDRFLEIMESEANRMTRLIDDLLSLSRIELDKHVGPDLPVDLLPLIKDVGRTLAIRLESGGRQIIVDAPEQLPPVTAERDQILQVLHNLVSNALKYGKPDTPIALKATVESSADGAQVCISVTDQGDGIAPEHLPRLTERFYRVDTARSRSMGGTGLGLAIVKHIVERHRGNLKITSTLGVGTTVSVRLPVAQGSVGKALSQ